MRSLFGDMGEQLSRIWQRLGAVQRAVLVGLLALGVVMLAVFVLWARQPDYAVAFSGLDEAEAGEIVERLREQQIPYRVGSGGAIMVPRASVHEVRLAMASEGLPSGGKIGFELFDTSSLGMTEFYQEVNYRRALEGELGRTIASLAPVRQARVHLVLPQQSLYTTQQAPPTASVVVDLAPGASLSPDQIRSIRFLVAGSVERLEAENLTIVDTAGNTLAAGGIRISSLEQALELSAQQIEIQRAYERTLQNEIQAMLEQLVGPGRAVVQTAVEMDWDQVESYSETFAPGDGQQGVLRSMQETNEIYSGALAAVGGIPGTAANLPPEPEEELPGDQLTEEGGAAYERRDIVHNYEVSRVETKATNAPGRVQRVAVSVLVDGVFAAQEMADIRETVAAAVGLNEARGDVISVKAMPFDRTFVEQEAQAMEQARRQELYLTIAKWAGLIILVLVLLIYIRSLLYSLRPPMVTEAASVAALGAGGAQALAGLNPRALQSGEIDLTRLPKRERKKAELAMIEQQEQQAEIPAPEPEEPEDTTPPSIETEELESKLLAEREARQRIQRQVVAVAQSEPRAVVQVLRDWLAEDSETSR